MRCAQGGRGTIQSEVICEDSVGDIDPQEPRVHGGREQMVPPDLEWNGQGQAVLLEIRIFCGS